MFTYSLPLHILASKGMAVAVGFYYGTTNITLDWPWIAEWAYAGIFGVAVQIQNQDQLWISHQKNQGSFFFLRKS